MKFNPFGFIVFIILGVLLYLYLKDTGLLTTLYQQISHWISSQLKSNTDALWR